MDKFEQLYTILNFSRCSWSCNECCIKIKCRTLRDPLNNDELLQTRNRIAKEELNILYRDKKLKRILK